MSASLATAIAAIVGDAGYRPTINDDDVVAFKVEGQAFELQTFGSDDGYARLILGYALPPNGTLDAVLRVANTRNADTKGVKVTVYPEYGNVLFSVEPFFDDVERLRPTLERSLAAMRRASNEFFEDLQRHESEIRDAAPPRPRSRRRKPAA